MGGRGEREGGKGTHIIMYRQRRILRTPHLPILITLPQPKRTRRIPQLGRLSQQLCRILTIHKQHIIDPPLMQQRKFMEGMGELCGGRFGTAFEPFDAFFGGFGEGEFAVEFGDAEAVHRAWVECGGGFAVEGEGFGGVASAAPAVLAACSCAVSCIWMAVFGGEDEEGKSTVEVLFVFVCADTVGVAVC